MDGDEELEARVARVAPPVAPDVQRAYESRVLPAIAALVGDWWAAYDGADRELWSVRASVEGDGVFVAAPDDDALDAICCPRDLNDATLLIGWQRYRNPAIRDPKCALAERLIALVLTSGELAAHVEIEDMDDIAEELGLYQRARGFVSDNEEERARENREDAEELEQQQQQAEQDEADESRRRRREDVRNGGATVQADSGTGSKIAAIKAKTASVDRKRSVAATVKAAPGEVELNGWSEDFANVDVGKNFDRD